MLNEFRVVFIGAVECSRHCLLEVIKCGIKPVSLFSLSPEKSKLHSDIVKEGAFVGSGTVVKQSVCIGKWTTIGMGSMVIKTVQPYSSVVGVPARESKRRTVR